MNMQINRGGMQDLFLCAALFHMLAIMFKEKDMCITGISQAILELPSFEVGTGNHLRGHLYASKMSSENLQKYKVHFTKNDVTFGKSQFPNIKTEDIFLPSCFSIQFSEQLLKFLGNFTLLKYVKSQRSYGFLITKELIFGFQILDLKDHFSASLTKKKPSFLSHVKYELLS